MCKQLSSVSELFFVIFFICPSIVNPFSYLCFVFVILSCLSLAALWSPAGKGLSPFGSLVCDVFLCFCHFQIWCPG